MPTNIPTNTTDLLILIMSVPFLLTLVALIRKYAVRKDGTPVIDGPWVAVLTLALAEAACVLNAVLRLGWAWYYGGILGLVTAVFCLGGSSFADRLVDRHASAITKASMPRMVVTGGLNKSGGAP